MHNTHELNGCYRLCCASGKVCFKCSAELSFPREAKLAVRRQSLQNPHSGRVTALLQFVNRKETRPSKLCKYLILNFGTFLEEFFSGQFSWKHFVGKVVENCWWKKFGRMGGTQTFNKAGRGMQQCLYISADF